MAKNLSSVSALRPLASSLPVQRPPEAAPEPAKPQLVERSPKAAPASEEATLQISLRLRKSLGKQLDRLALDADMTKRAFILAALRDKGLDVSEFDLADARKQRT